MTSEPMSDDELEHARRRQADPLVQVSQTETLLLQEVERLRAENTAQTERLAETEAELDRFRRAEYRRLEAALAKAKTNPVKPSLSESLGANPAAPEVGPIHFAPYGGAFTTCGEALPKNTPWSVVRGDFDTSKYTTRRAETTCPQCRAALGLVQDREGQADA